MQMVLLDVHYSQEKKDQFFVLKIKYYFCILKFMEFWFYFVSFVFLSMNKNCT